VLLVLVLLRRCVVDCGIDLHNCSSASQGACRGIGPGWLFEQLDEGIHGRKVEVDAEGLQALQPLRHREKTRS